MLSPLARCVSMRLSSLRLLTRPVNATISSRLASTEVIMKYTNLDKAAAMTALDNHKLLEYAKDDKVHITAKKLEELGISKEDIGQFPEILATLALTLDNHAHILKECGFSNLGAHEIAFYRQLMTRRITLIKAHGYLKDNCSIAHRILSQIPDLPSDIAKEIDDKIGPVNDKTSLREIHKKVTHHYLCWKFQANSEQIRKIMDIYFRLRHRSIILIIQCIDILTNHLGFTLEKILNHGYLISGHPHQMRETMKRVPTLGGLPLQEAIHKHPRIMVMATDTLISTSELFKQFGINNEQVRKCFMIYTLSTYTVKERLIAAINDPQLGMFLDHPRILILILYSKTAAKRLNQLRQLQMQCYSLHLICASSSKKFEKFTTLGEDFHRGYDTVYYIARSLNCDASNLRQALNRHPHWTGVPLSNVRATLLLLAERKFPPDHIREAVQLLLYPAEQVAEVLDSIDYSTPKTYVDWSPQLRYEHITSANGSSSKITQLLSRKKCTEHYFSSSILEKIPCEDSTTVEFRLVLHTCLYLLEKPHHFTGNGIWIQNSGKEDKDMAVSSA